MSSSERPTGTWTSGLVHIMYDDETDRAIERMHCYLHVEVPARYVYAARNVAFALARIETRGPTCYCVLYVPSAKSPIRLVMDVAGRANINALRALAGMGVVRLVLSDEAQPAEVDATAVANLQVIGLESCLMLAETMGELPEAELQRIVAEHREEAAEEGPGKLPWVGLAAHFPGLVETGFLGH